MIRIVLDNIIFILQKSGGISVVWIELLKRLLKNTSVQLECIEYEVNENIHRKEITIPTQNLLKFNPLFFFLERFLTPVLQNTQKFIFHSSYYRISSNPNAINITTVHDFTYEYYFSGIKKKIHLWQKYDAISKSDYIICISENTKSDLLKFLPHVDSAKVRIVYNGVSDNYFPVKEEHVVGLPFESETYVLFVGSREKYKKFELAVKAVASDKLKLVIVGSPLSQKEQRFLHKELGQANFTEMGRVSNMELNNLYNGAMALLYPSEYEGFGIPVLEAQKAGCPVIAFNGSSMPEVIGDTPLLINSLSEESIIECFDILRIKEKRQSIIDAGIANAKQFTWDRTYQQVIAIYEEAWEKSSK